MQSRIFSNIISSRPAPPVRNRFDLRQVAISFVAVLTLAFTGGGVAAQVTNPAPANEQPSPKNPLPRATGDNQNRNRAHDDKYWGQGDTNRRWFEIPYSRIPDPGSVARGNGRLVADGWQFPQPRRGEDDLRRTLDFGGGAPATLPGGALPAGDGIRYFAAPWVTATAPSTSFIDTDYLRTPAVPRPAAVIPENTINPPAPTPYPQNTVKWFPNIPGAAGTLRRFTIRIYLPTPEPFPTDGTLGTETRVEDARYLVYFNVRVGATIETRRRVILRSQSGAGWVTLTDSNDQPILFPMATEATGLIGRFRPRVELDNTTQGDTGTRFIIADQIQFVPSAEYGEIKAPTTVTPIHGGRKTIRDPNFTLGNPYDPDPVKAAQHRQPAWTTDPVSRLYDIGAPAGTAAFPNDSFDFINNPRELTYAGNPEAADPIYEDATLPFYQPFEGWNPSTLFQGPRSLIDDQTGEAVTVNGNPVNTDIGLAPAARVNQERYVDANGLPIPLFSHMQVLVPRTEYVPDPDSADGLGSLAVGCVYGVDWLTGTPLWRFPDRTHLPRSVGSGVPGNVGSYIQPGTTNITVVNSGLRNPNISVTRGLPAVTVTVPSIPGIGAYDKNGDGYIADDEVYIVGQGGNPGGGIEAGITLVPRNYTRAAPFDSGNTNLRTSIPVYNDAWNPYTSPVPNMLSSNPNATSIVDVVDVPQGRYSATTNGADGFPAPVEAGMAIVASNNGVIYAIDPYGNNDNRYYNFNDGTTEDTTRFGTYRNGSTNAFWTFSVTAPVRANDETDESYNQKLKESVPATGPWGRSTPVISYAKDDTDLTLNRFTEEPRLFIGNSNGVLYAINAVSDAGRLVDVNPDPMIETLEYRFSAFPFRKEDNLSPVIGNERPDLRWWFETEAAINAAPAVSASRHPEYQGSAVAADDEKGVYVTSNDGRVYCIDWNGPVTKGSHNNNLNYVGTTGAARRASAEALNDNFRFHNNNSVAEFAIADGTEGTIRPRWVFPSRYRDIDGNNDNSELAPIQPADNSNVFPDAFVERQTRLAPINSAPSLMDYPFDADPNDPNNAIEIKRYVAVVANDLNGSDAPIRGRVYLLDQVGDRRDFSVNPVQRTAAVTGSTAVAFGQPEDMYAPTEYVFSDATPAWTYRSVYRRYTNAGVTEDVSLRNRPTRLNNVNGEIPDAATATGVNGAGLPEKRTLPTLFVGGPVGRLFALDIDPQTGLFLRWRGTIAATAAFTPLPTSYTAANLPVNEPIARRLSPPNPVLAAITVGGTSTLNDRPPLVRTVALLDTEDVSAITISGGPQQNRNHPFATAAPVTGPTVPGLPTNDPPRLLYPGVPYTPNPLAAPGDVPTTGVRPPYWNATNVNAVGAGGAPDFTGFALVAVPSFDFTGRFVNQDHDDPATTTGGTYPDPREAISPDPSTSLVALNPEANRAYQQPILAVTTTDGSFTLVSTELEGLDSIDEVQGTDTEALLGWGLTSDPRLVNSTRPFLLSIRGPGGPGTQVAIVTNAHYGAMDPGFRNTVTKQNGFGTSPVDESRTNFPYYPWYEPRVDPLNTVVGTAPYDDPRPRFEPRSLYSGNTANPNGPDGDPATGDGWPEIKADAHTGRTGFPLDLRGLFFDKKFAANPTATVAATNTNDDGLLRLPAYTGIGEALAAADRRERRRQTNRLPIPPAAAATRVVEAGPGLADGTPDTPRDSSTGATPPWRTNPDELFPGTPPAVATATTNGSEADINPPGTNVAWLFVGGSDGVFYSYTPNRFSVPGTGFGLGSGFVGGTPKQDPNQVPGLLGNAKFMLVSAATYNDIVSNPRRPTPADDLLLNNGKPFFEYGESVYGIVYDIGPNGGSLVDGNGDGRVTELAGEATFPSTINVQFRPYNGIAGRSLGGNTTATVLVAAPVISPFRYPYNAAQQLNRPEDPSLVNAPTSDRAIALVEVQINTNFNQGGSGGGRRPNLSRFGGANVGWTPGAIYEVSANGFSGIGGGATAPEALANTPPLISIANPIAIQAFLLSNNGGRLATVADPANDPGNPRPYNNIGPFASDNGSIGGTVKDRVATSANIGGNTAFDPDRFAAEYNQALANGNRISRFDLIPFGTGGAGTRNPNYGKPLVSTATGTGIEATYEPTYYMPIAASAGMIDHGKPGSTNVTNDRKTLRIVNRSLQGSLGKLRVELRSDALFRSWPGDRPHVRPNDGSATVPTPSGTVTVATPGNGNPRLTPVGAVNGVSNVFLMRPDGVVNFLPWEQPVFASLPWERDSAAVGVVASLSNTSRDYPDIAAQSEAASNQQIVRLITPSGDVLKSNGSLAASVSATLNQTIGDASIRDWTFAGAGGNFQAATAEVQITVPKFQPANLVAMHSLTSTYVKPSADEAPADASADGDIQLPRSSATGNGLNRASTDRALRVTGNQSATSGDIRTVTPMGYTLQMRAYIDINGDGNHDGTEPYRDFETWFGVPVDVAMEQAEGGVTLPGAKGAAFSHGVGQQNGYLGYGLAAAASPGGRSVGFLPPFLTDADGTALTDPYGGFFAPLTVQSKSNVNLWNVRASQKIERYNSNPTPGDAAGDGSDYSYFAMQSQSVDPRFGILSVEADPTGYNPTGIMPNVVTSLDRKFDAAWDLQFNNPTTRLFGLNYNPLRVPVNGTGSFTRYQAYYAGFGGRHTLHKPAPGTQQGTVLSVPDVPIASLPQTVSPGPNGPDNFPVAGTFLPPVQAEKPALGIAVPLGTPSGNYSNNESGTPLAFFEDHDTELLPANGGYRNIPLPTGATSNSLALTTAGPLYSGQNYLHPGQIGPNAIRPTSGEGIFRPRRIVGRDDTGLPLYEYLPSTTVTTNNNRVGFNITVNVKESALTGQIADQGLFATGFPISIVNGVLPGVDNAPLFDYTNIPANGTARPVSALAPAAYRTPGGDMILFHNANAVVQRNGRTGDARPGAPFNLFRSVLTWDAAQGTWVAAAPGAPITGDALFNQGNSAGGWFSAPQQLTVGNAPNESNLSPFVLNDPLMQSGLASSEATLFMMNVIPTSSGESQYTPYFAPLGTTGTPGAFTSLLPRTGNNRIDATLRRFGPRAVYVPSAEAAFVMYYGGSAGKNNLLYVTAPADGSGRLTGPGNREITLRLPASVTSASDPMPMVRRARIVFNTARNVWVYDPQAQPQYVVDVHYTAVLRSGGSADICVSRYRIAGSGVNARLQPIDMPRQINEELVSASRAPVYRSKHIGWYNRLDNSPNVPSIQVVRKAGAVEQIVYQTVPQGWKLDNATRLLFQPLQNAVGIIVPNLLVYVDTSAGTVTFRGANAPSRATTNLVVRATYLPLAYRVAATDAVESSTFGFMDRRPVEITLPLPQSGVTNDDGNTLGWYSYGVQTRYNRWNNLDGGGIDRQWLYWQRSASAGLPARLFTTTRRVGVDLKSVGILTATQSLKLSPNAGSSVNPLQFVVGANDTTPITVQMLAADNVTVLGNIPFEVNYKEGRIYTQAEYEGLTVRITGQRGIFGAGSTATGEVFTADAILSPVDEIIGGTDGVGQEMPSTRRVNENQPYAFLDLYDGRDAAGGRRTQATSLDVYPDVNSDPALQPGKVWMFWSSSQGRSGLARVPDATFSNFFGVPVGGAITSSGYDLFWQTLAPNFSYPSFSGFP